MSKDGYLPPGVESGDLPGNMPEDEEWDKLFEWFPADLTPADIKDRVAHAPAIQNLIAIYERDRTRHLRLIEGADTDLAELGESLGEEIERLTSVCDEQEGALRESQSLASKRFFLLQTAENQRDELFKAATNVEGAMSKIFALLNAWAKLELPAQDSDYSGIIAQVYGDLAAHHGEIRAAIERATP